MCLKYNIDMNAKYTADKYHLSHLSFACRELSTTMSVLLSREVQADMRDIVTHCSLGAPSHDQLAPVTLRRGKREADKLPAHHAVSGGGFEVEIEVSFPRACVRFEGSAQPAGQLLSRVGLQVVRKGNRGVVYRFHVHRVDFVLGVFAGHHDDSYLHDVVGEVLAERV